jgi:hypothetical protein
VVPENYLPMGEVRAGESHPGSDDHWGSGAHWGAGRPFLKLTATVGLDRWAEAPVELVRLYTLLVGVLCEH